MRGAVAIIGSVAIIAGALVFYATLPSTIEERREAAFRAELATQRAEQRAELDVAQWDMGEITATALAVAFSGLLVYMFYHTWQDRRRIIYPDAHGNLPVARRDVESGALAEVAAGLMQMARQVEAIAAAQQPVPAHLSYAPHITTQAPAVLSNSAPAALAADESNEPAPLELPNNVALADRLADIPVGHLAYGVLPGGELLLLPMGSAFHTLGSGDTRSGKTNWIDGLIVQLHHQATHYALKIYAGDFKGELRATWQRSSLIPYGVETDPAAIAELIDELVNGPDGVRARYARFEAASDRLDRVVRNISEFGRVTGEQLPLGFLVLDELNALLEAIDRKNGLQQSLIQLLQMGAGAGVYVLSGAQYLEASLFKRSGSKQFVTRCQFGAYDHVASRTLFSQVPEEATRALLGAVPGRGLIRTVRQPAPVLFQALRCDESDILEAIGQCIPGAATPGEQAVSSPTHPVGTSVAPEGAEVLHGSGTPQTIPERVTSEQAATIRRMRSEGINKETIVRLVFGISKGGNSKYKQAAEAYDAVLNEREVSV